MRPRIYAGSVTGLALVGNFNFVLWVATPRAKIPDDDGCLRPVEGFLTLGFAQRRGSIVMMPIFQVSAVAIACLEICGIS